MTTPRLAYAAKLLCSFCGKDHEEVRKLIAGPTVFICDECVRLCQEIIAEVDATPAQAFTPEQEAALRNMITTLLAESAPSIEKILQTLTRVSLPADRLDLQALPGACA